MKETFSEWFDKQPSYGLCDPPMNSDRALQFLTDYLLPENYYVAIPENKEQVNTAIVIEILYKYSKKFRKEVHKRNKKKGEKK